MADDQTDYLELYLLPPGQDVTIPLTQPDAEELIAQLRAWLRQAGYTPIGPAMLGWDEWAVRHIRQPIAPVFAPQAAPPYRVVMRPELLVADLPVTMRSGTFNLAGVYDFVREYGLDPLGAPYVPLELSAGGAGEPHPHVGPRGAGATRGFLPVVPGGTSSLIPLPGWYSGKMGLLPRPPQYGLPASAWMAFEHTGLILLRTLIGLILMAIVLLPYFALCGITGGILRDAGIRAILLSSLIPFVLICGLLEALIGAVMIWTRLRAVRRWNDFWRRTPLPPTLSFDSETESLYVR